MKLIADISPLVAKPKTGVGVLAENLIRAFKKRKDLKVGFFAVTPRAAAPQLKKRYPAAEVLKVPARLLNPSLNLIQKLDVPVEMFTGLADAVISFDWLCLPMRTGLTVAVIPDTTPITNPEWYTEENISWYQRRLKAIEKNADLVVTISNSSKQEIIKNTGITKGRIIVSYPGVPSDFKKASPKKLIDKVQEDYELPHSYLLFVGTEEPRKNFRLLVNAFETINPKIRKTTTLVVVGKNGPGKQLLKKLGQVPDAKLPPIYTKAQGLVYPSFKEGFGFPIVEAFASGVPVLTSNTSSMKEIANGAAILVNPSSIDSIRDGLLKLLALDENSRKKMCKAGKRRLKKFSFDKMADKIIKSIMELQ